MTTDSATRKTDELLKVLVLSSPDTIISKAGNRTLLTRLPVPEVIDVNGDVRVEGEAVRLWLSEDQSALRIYHSSLHERLLSPHHLSESPDAEASTEVPLEMEETPVAPTKKAFKAYVTYIPGAIPTSHRYFVTKIVGSKPSVVLGTPTFPTVVRVGMALTEGTCESLGDVAELTVTTG
jgi:hypothetical protein